MLARWSAIAETNILTKENVDEEQWNLFRGRGTVLKTVKTKMVTVTRSVAANTASHSVLARIEVFSLRKGKARAANNEKGGTMCQGKQSREDKLDEYIGNISQVTQQALRWDLRK